jgi:UDP-N-acetylmuramate--alanine ligase
MVGIGGSGMRALAGALDAAGWQVSGSDLQTDALAGCPFKARRGHSSDAVDGSLDLVVYSDAVPPHNVELAHARQLGIPLLSYPRMLGRLMESRAGVAIAGTHGKSTTTAMAGEILRAAGLAPTVIYGAEPIDPSSRSRLGRGRWMLAEACEYRSNFLHLAARMAVILGVELDHCDCFVAQADVEAAFAQFAHRVPADGLVLARAECDATRRAIAEVRCSTETFGFSASATWQVTALRHHGGYYSFQLRNSRRLVCDVKLSVPGRHNVENAVAAAAVASHCGATGGAIRAGLARFAGLRRRLEVVADDGQIAVVDDYAHHPTEVTAAIAAVRQLYPGRRIWCVFQPHQASRTRRLLDEFAHSLHNADKIVVAEIVRAREGPGGDQGITAADLAERIARLGGDATYRASAEDIKRHLDRRLCGGGVLVTLGAGDIGAIAHDVGQRLRTIRKAG